MIGIMDREEQRCRSRTDSPERRAQFLNDSLDVVGVASIVGKGIFGGFLYLLIGVGSNLLGKRGAEGTVTSMYVLAYAVFQRLNFSE